MNILIYPASGILEFNSLSAGSSALDSTLSGVRFSFNTGEMQVYGKNNANLNRFGVYGIEGQLFEVTDTMSGSLFSVNDFVGLPLIEVYNDSIKLGSFNNNNLVITGDKVGIGISNPATLLDVNGDFKAWQIDLSGQSGDPRTYNQGDIWYNSRDRVLRTRVNSQNNSLALGKTFAVFTANDSYPPASAATTGVRNSIRTLVFGDAATANTTFVGLVPTGICLNSGITARIFWTAASATSANVLWSFAFENMWTDLDADSFDTATSGVSAAGTPPGALNTGVYSCTNIDGLREGLPFRLRVTRTPLDALDTMVGNAELVLLELQATL
jgi:hypothetical protein